MQKLSRDALEAIVGSIPAGVVVIAKEKGKTIYANERAIQLFGTDPSGLEMPDHSTKLMKLLTLNGDVFPPEQLPASIALLTGENAQAEVVIERRDGSRVITEGSAKPIRDEKGEVIAAVTIFEDITERKQAKEVLRVSEEKFSKAFEDSPFAVTLTRLSDGAIVDANNAALKAFGFARNEIVDKTTFELRTWAFAEDRIALAKELSLKGSFHNQEVILLKKDGNRFYANMSAAIVTINAEKYWIASFIDITERKKAEEELRQSEEKYRQIVTTAQEGILILDQQGKITYLNKVLADWIGYRIEELMGEIVFKFIAEDLEKTYERWEKRRVGVVESYDLKLKRKDGADVWLIVNGNALKDKEGNFVGLLAMITNITERKKIELTCKESEERFRGLVESTSDWIWQVDQNAVYTYASLKVKEILGYEPREVLGKTPFDLMPKDQVEEMTKIFTEIARNKSRLHNLENLAVHKNGNILVLETSGVPIEDEKGNFVGYRGIDRDITERKKVEQSLKESEALYHTLFDNSQDGFMLLEPIFGKEGKACDFRFLKLNSVYERQTGAKAADVLGKLASEVTPELEPEIALFSGDVAKTGKPIHNETYNRYANRWFDSYFFPYSKSQVGILFRDITERKKAEENLMMEKERFRSLADSLPEIVFETDLNGRVTFANQRGFEITGYSPEDLVKGFDVFSLIAPEDKEKAIEHFSKSLKNQPSIDNEYLVLRKDGSTFPAIIVTSLTIDKDRPIGLRGIVIDITERKKAEEELKESEEKFQNMFEQSPAVFEIYDKNGIEVQVNRAWDKLWNIPRENVIGKYNVLQSKQIAETGWLPLLKKVFVDGETVFVPEKEFDASLEPEGLGKGRKRWLKSLFYPIKNSHGEITNIVFMHEDITEKKVLEKQLQDKERMATIGETAGMIGHDIRNPLQAIVSELYLAKQAMAEAPKDKQTQDTLESLNLIEEEVGYVNKIVADLQDYARPIKPELVEVELKTLVTGALSTLNVPDNIKAESYFVEELPKLASDPTIMKRVLFNLANNALQAMPKGGKLTIHVSQDKKTSCIIIAVEDTGVGIPKEIQDKLFVPLFTTKSKGQGFGSVAVKRMVEALGGTVSFESQEGKGTTFTVSLPLLRDKPLNEHSNKR
jgi:PAS domain S-box-containing protein